jgi:hypothetical protein
MLSEQWTKCKQQELLLWLQQSPSRIYTSNWIQFISKSFRWIYETYQNPANHRYFQCSWHYAKYNCLEKKCNTPEQVCMSICLEQSNETNLVPRSIARVRPPVWRERWKRRSRFSRCSNVSLATFRMARCPMLAKTALRSSPKTVAPIRAAPSVVWF